MGQIFSKISLVDKDGGIRILVREDRNDQNSERVYAPEQLLRTVGNDDIDELKRYQAVSSEVRKHVRSFLEKASTFIVVLTGLIGEQLADGPVVEVVSSEEGSPAHFNSKADGVVPAISTTLVRQPILCEAHMFYEMKTRRGILQSSIAEGSVTLEKRFDRSNWPTHPLMNHLKRCYSANY